MRAGNAGPGPGGTVEPMAPDTTTPARTADEQLLEFLHLSVASRPDANPHGYRYRCIEDLVAVHGTAMVVTASPDGRRGVPNQCFANSLQRALQDPDRYAYCEGYALGTVIPLLHAWVHDLETGTTFDPTWPAPGTAYRGIVFDTRWAEQATLERGYYSVLDNYQQRWPLLRGLPDGAVITPTRPR